MPTTLKYSTTFDTMPDALTYASDELKRYPQEGYDTLLTISPMLIFSDDGVTRYQVEVSRLSSCD